jgi:hypothetical protein
MRPPLLRRFVTRAHVLLKQGAVLLPSRHHDAPLVAPPALGLVCKLGQTVRHDKNRTNRYTVGTVAAAFASTETPDGTTKQESSHDHQRHPMDTANGGTVARLARAVRLVENGLQPLLPLAERRNLAADFGETATTG